MHCRGSKLLRPKPIHGIKKVILNTLVVSRVLGRSRLALRSYFFLKKEKEIIRDPKDRARNGNAVREFSLAKMIVDAENEAEDTYIIRHPIEVVQSLSPNLRWR